MALVTQRIWRSGARKVKRAAWGYTFMKDGKQLREFHEEWTKQQAEEALAARLLGLQPEAPSQPVGMTFGAMVEKFLAKKRAEGKRSIGDDEDRAEPLKAFFGVETPLSAITTRRVDEYRVARLASKTCRKGLRSPATVNRECALLRSIMRLALKWDEIAKAPSFEMTRERRKERFLSVDEMARLVAACEDSRNARLAAIVTLGLQTGMRKGELVGLRWETIDFSRGIITLGNDTKGGRGREIPVNETVYAVLAPLRKAAGGQDAKGRVWGSLRKIDTAYEFALERAKIFDPDVNFHTLRHSFASHYVMQGGRLEKLQEMLGHASIKTTQVYAHLAPGHVAGATNILDGLIKISARSTHEPAEVDAHRVTSENHSTRP